jgi:sulfatase modifying factor 1
MASARIDLAEEAAFQIGKLSVRPSERSVGDGDGRQVIEPRMMQVLIALAREPGTVVSRERLMERCWSGTSVGDDALNRVIAKLRQVAETTGSFTLETIPKVGYRLTPTEPPETTLSSGPSRPSVLVVGGLAAVALLVVLAVVLSNHIPALARHAPYWGPKAFTDCSDLCPEMVVLPRGRFRMGSAAIGGADQTPAVEVRIEYELAVSRYDITRAQYAHFVAATGRTRSGGCATFNLRGLVEEGNGSWDDPGFPQTPRDPVVCVNWADATAYAAWLSQKTGKAYRLPSDAEWEYAARGGAKGRTYWPSGSLPCAYLNAADSDYARVFKWDEEVDRNCRDAYVYTSPVGVFPANGFGLYDMLGDVVQWAADCADPPPQKMPIDGSAWTTRDCSARNVRGSAWNENPLTANLGRRLLSDMEGRFPTNGFRVVRALD